MDRPHSQQLDICVTVDPAGVIRVAVLGELDLFTGGILEDRLKRLGEAGATIVLDLSALAFIDASGLRAVIHSLADAGDAGRRLHVDRRLSRNVARLLELTAATSYLWPGNPAELPCGRRIRSTGGRPLRGRRPPIRPRI